MKKSIGILLLSIYAITMTACGSVSKDSYVEGMDYQYQFYSRDTFTTDMAQGEDAIYFVTEHYIYRLDEETGTLTPLCNKPNCLHAGETDDSRASECNAYISRDSDIVGIAYMDGYIYTVMWDMEDGDWYDSLYKIAEDGSTKEKIYQWEGDIVEGWCLHRNVLYYVEHIYDEGNQEHYSVKEMKLKGSGKLKPKTVYEPDEEVTVYAFDTPHAYGNHIYFSVNGAKTKDVEQAAGDNWAEYMYTKTFQYDLQKEEITEIRTPEQSDTEVVQNVTFWQDHIVYQAFDCAKDNRYDATEDVYIADLDGTNAVVLMEDMSMYRWYSSDGNYLYVSNTPECLDTIYQDYDPNDDTEKKYEFVQILDVYDKNMELVDSMQAPFHTFPTEPVYGIGDKMYILIQNDTRDGIQIECWDKTKIGTYHGKEYELTKVCDMPLSKAELQEMGEE